MYAVWWKERGGKCSTLSRGQVWQEPLALSAYSTESAKMTKGVQMAIGMQMCGE